MAQIHRRNHGHSQNIPFPLAAVSGNKEGNCEFVIGILANRLVLFFGTSTFKNVVEHADGVNRLKQT